MTTAQQYAQALWEVVAADPHRPAAHLANLRAALAARGHEKLLPHIFSEYKKLELKKKRSAEHQKITPQMRRTQVLLELYERLVASS
jgi:hypothetical protein